MKDTPVRVSPIALTERFVSLDVLRGFAVLGILLMNIQSYSMISAAYLNPMAYGDLTGLNKWTWILSHMLADQKFLSIFSILFGAGIILFSQKAESKGRRPSGLHYRRTLWLFFLGMLHAYLLWYGDILVAYALCALLVFLFRKRSPLKLLIFGLIAMSVSSIFYLFFGLSISHWPPEAVQNTITYWKPAAETVAQEVSAYRGAWLDQMSHRIPSSIAFQTFIFLVWTSWRAGGLMLVGMALFKWRVLTAQRSKRLDLVLMTVGFGIGFPVIILGVVRNYAAGFSFEYSMYLGSQFNYWGSLFIAMGYIAAVMLIYKAGILKAFTDRLAAVGRMAFSNYIMQTLICTTLFYGHGFGLYGRVDRQIQILIVISIWIVQLLYSPLWLRYFRFGPLEWLWRSLTYLKVQPFRNHSCKRSN